MRFEELPLAAGQAVGVLGGSFDPPHEGHLHISHEALRRFGLDRLVWLVSPGNPLKRDAPAPMAQRMARARELVDHPRIDVSDFEARHGTRFTAETLEQLRHVHRGVRFVWIMGADNLVQFHRWDNWQGILRSVPVGVLARPGQRLAARSSVAARAWRDARLPEHASHLLPLCQAPAWCFVNVPMREVSSTEIRARGGWPAPGGTQA